MSGEDRRKLKILGGGTNILVNDANDLDFIVLKLEGEFQQIVINQNEIRAGSGVLLPKFLREMLNAGFGGMEILAGIPGTVGGAILGNAGSKYGDISQFVKSVKVIDFKGNIENLPKKNIIFNYRKTQFLKDCIILDIEFDKTSFECFEYFENDENKQKLQEKFNLILKQKINSQPYNTKNAGCVFKNPESFSVGKIIDELGLKGTKIGDLFISEKHANFFVADDNARYKDFVELMDFVKEKIKTEKNLEIEPEIKIWR